MTLKVAINCYGPHRAQRCGALRKRARNTISKIVAINDLGDAASRAPDAP